MGADALASPNQCNSATVAVDKVDKQSAARFTARGRLDHARMVARLGLLRVRLERPGYRAARHLAADSNRRAYRCCRIILPDCVCERNHSHNGVSPDCRSTHTRDATAF